MTIVARQYYSVPFYSDCVSEKILREQIPLIFPETTENEDEQVHRVLSLLSGCGGMDLGFEGHFIANKNHSLLMIAGLIVTLMTIGFY